VTGEHDPAAVARGIVDANRYMALGTADESGLPWVSPVWYAPAGYSEFFWVSDPEARHSRNLAARPQVSIAIFDSHEPGGWRSVYISAVGGQLTGADVDRGIEVFSRRSVAQGMREWTPEDVRSPAHHRLYRAEASEHFVLDEHDRRIPVSVE
jgi:hypothetical protein